MTKKINLRAILTAGCFLIILFGFAIMNLVTTPPKISKSERRPLKTMPEFSVKSVVAGKFMNEFEDYAADSFVFREELRTLRAFTVFHVMRQTDKSGLYYGNSGAGKFEPINETEFRRFCAKILTMAQRYEKLNVYYSIISDKSIYAGHYLPGYDPKLANAILSEELAKLTSVDISSVLTGEDFYRSDLHWDQSRLLPVVSFLSKQMGFEYSLDDLILKDAGVFEGVWTEQLALPIPKDRMKFFVPKGVDEKKLTAKYLTERGAIEERLIYDPAEFDSGDPYSFFLRGPQPVIWLDGQNPTSDKTLYIFRDSYTSSLAPLLAFGGGYSEVVLIDLRYIDSRILDQYVEFKDGSDVLFLHGSQLMNNSTVLKVH